MIRYLLIILLLTGCYTERKAKDQFSKAAIAYPKIPAEFCANEFPVIAKTDSTEYKNSKAIIDSLAKALQNDSLLSDEERQRLTLEIERVKGLITEPKKCDTLSDAIYKLLAKERLRGDKLQLAYNNLIIALKDLKPVHDTIVDAAALRSCEIDKSKLINLTETQAADIKKYKRKANTRGYMMWGLLLLIALVFGANIWWKAKKITFK